MNTRRKGNRGQLELIKHLESKGFIVDKVEKTGRFTESKDMFGLFDLVAIKAHCIYFIQVTHNNHHTHKRLIEWVNLNGENVMVVQMVKYDYKGWKRFDYSLAGGEVLTRGIMKLDYLID